MDIDKEHTPETSELRLRQRHVPTPKMSDRKKSLFATGKGSFPLTIRENSDSDLGPMSPLQFSCSPSNSHDTVERYIEKGSFFRPIDRRVDFKNIMQQLSPSTTRERRSASISPTKQPTGSSTQVTAIVHKNPDTIDDKENSNSNVSDKERFLLKTPHEPIAPIVDAPRVTYRKSLIFDTGLTPDDTTEIPANIGRYIQKRVITPPQKASELVDPPKARTSLTFPDLKISPQKFYGSTKDNASGSFKVQPRLYPLPTTTAHRPATKAAQKKRRRPTKFKLGRPVLGSVDKGYIHKIAKPKTASKAAKHSDLAPSTSKWIEEATRIMKDSPLNAYLAKQKSIVSSNGQPADTSITTEQTKRLREVLKNLKTTIVEYPLNWNGRNVSPTAKKTATEQVPCREEIVDESAAEAAERNTEDDEKRAKRKFFKSNRSSSEGCYRLTMNRVTATMKRGGEMTVQPSPKRKKQKIDNESYDEYLSIQQEVSDIINMLNMNPEDSDDIAEKVQEPHNAAADAASAPADIDEQRIDDAEKSPDDFRNMLPYKTGEPGLQQTQRYLLEMLITNNICTAETFRIFIAEPELHKDEAAQILDGLYVVDDTDAVEWTMEDEEIFDSAAIPTSDSDDQTIGWKIEPVTVAIDDNATDIIDDVPMSPASQISDMTSVLALCSPKTPEKSSQDVIPPSQSDTPSKKLYPIFRKYTKNSPTSSSTISSSTSSTNVGTSLQNQSQNVKTTLSEIRKWKTAMGKDGDGQLLIDAGQKRFGSITCKQCGMVYAVAEPQEEILHLKYHNSVHVLQFKGWSSEHCISKVPQWEADGRIIAVYDTDSKVKLNRIRDLLEKVVDRDLGYSINKWQPMTMVFLAIAKAQIIGACVVEPVKKAYHLITEDGNTLIDTTEHFPVKCGISRIWVAPPFRRIGVASKLILAVRIHYIRGYNIFPDEIAFSSPTEMGSSFAKKVCGTEQILVYDGSF